jgi:DNA polymerase III alpha subunit
MIVEARGDRPFTSLADFASRVSPRAINKRVVESLAAAGVRCLDSNRARVFAGADAIIAACQRSHEAVTSGQNDMFGGMADAPSIVLPTSSRGCRQTGCAANTTPSDSSCQAIHWTIIQPRLNACACNHGPSSPVR